MTLLWRIKHRITRTVFKLLVRASPRSDLQRLGSIYGGWIVPTSLLSSDSVCYLAGVGEDISFDLQLIDRFGCGVYAFDPTPRAIAYAEITDVPSLFILMPVGLWSSDTNLRFYAPANPEHVSHSIVNLQDSDDFFEAPVRGLSSLMSELGHTRIDLLKLDIEGAEYEVIDQMLNSDVDVRVLCVEFDQPTPLSKALGYVSRLKNAGFTPVAIDGWNVTFVASGRDK